ncbi:selenide, water dikinase SelD [Veillonella criceti]|uniref:selenide, water dikinase SelD n=1 Tax=Veillonella criceti TaxID=103891 RepID=UPI003BF5362E
MSNLVKLTNYAAKGGCACKLGPHILQSVLTGLEFPTNESVLVNMQGSDDAGVYQISNDMALVQTVDFFTPIVDDPYLFGRIAAANSLSDVYAMGGTPLTAMNLVGFPVPLVEQGALTAVLEGAMSVLKEAQVVVVGGHSIENETPIFGMSVTGHVNPHNIWRNSGAQVGDVLILTKPLGTGIMSTALKGDLFQAGTEEATQSMGTLNKEAREMAQAFTVHACTDITGFSLLGHSCEMAEGSGVSIVLQTEALPLFTGAIEAAEMGLVPAATYGNRKAITSVTGFEKLAPVWSDICYDPQTSGGLLLAVPAEERDALLLALKQAGLTQARHIGHVAVKGEYAVYVK